MLYGRKEIEKQDFRKYSIMGGSARKQFESSVTNLRGLLGQATISSG